MVSLRHSIAGRMITMILGIVIMVLFVTTAGSVVRELSIFNENQRRALVEKAQILSSAIATPMAAQDSASVLNNLTSIGRLHDVLYARVEMTSGVVFAEMGQVFIDPETNIKASDPVSVFVLFNAQTSSATVPIIKAGREIGRLTLYQDISTARGRLLKILADAGLTAGLATLFAFVAALILQRTISGPVRNLASIMSTVRDEADFTLEAKRETKDEVGDLVDAFNVMLRNIRDRDDKLADHRRSLESTVEKRTRQFRRAKDDAERANAAKSDFLATMSHEIRTPMNGIMVMAELLSSAKLTPRYQRYASVIVNSGQSLLSIINDILDLSKIEAGKMDLEEIEFSPAQIAGDVINLFAEKATSKGLDIAAYIAPDVPSICLGDPVRINQIISNLVNNAIKFTKDGHVSITVKKSPERQNYLHFAVHDTGIGIAEDKLSHVFDSFSQADQSTTRHYGGTGLGLSICKKLVAAMGGEIGIHSTLGEGSCFFFEIAAAAISQQNITKLLTGKAITVMLNKAATRQSITQTLSDFGASVVTIGENDIAAVESDVIIATATAIQKLPKQAAPKHRICLAAIGDNLPEQLITDSVAQDLLFQPVLHTDLTSMITRIAENTLRGKNAITSHGTQINNYATFDGLKALVADDSAVNREVIIEAMKCLKVSVVTVVNGREAVEAMRDASFDLVFMDCSMPEMDGYEATRRIRATEIKTGRKRTPVIALTAQMAGTAQEAWKDAGMDAFMTKPFTLEQLSKIMAQFVSPSTQAKATQIARIDDDEMTSNTETSDEIMLDPATLENLRQMGAASGKDLAARALQLFSENAPHALKAIADALKSDDRAALAKAAHALKSMSLNVGALPLGEACKQIETIAAQGEAPAAEQTLMLVDRFQATVHAILARG